VNPHEVVVHEVQGDRVRVHLDLLAERIRQPGEAAHVHPHRQVLRSRYGVLMCAGSGSPATILQSTPKHFAGLYRFSSGWLA
jgi:hypothetical protein